MTKPVVVQFTALTQKQPNLERSLLIRIVQAVVVSSSLQGLLFGKFSSLDELICKGYRASYGQQPLPLPDAQFASELASQTVFHPVGVTPSKEHKLALNNLLTGTRTAGLTL